MEKQITNAQEMVDHLLAGKDYYYSALFDYGDGGPNLKVGLQACMDYEGSLKYSASSGVITLKIADRPYLHTEDHSQWEACVSGQVPQNVDELFSLKLSRVHADKYSNCYVYIRDGITVGEIAELFLLDSKRQK